MLRVVVQLAVSQALELTTSARFVRSKNHETLQLYLLPLSAGRLDHRTDSAPVARGAHTCWLVCWRAILPLGSTLPLCVIRRLALMPLVGARQPLLARRVFPIRLRNRPRRRGLWSPTAKMYVPSDSKSPERKAADALTTFFTFVACK